MNALFVSYFAVWKGEHRGWLVFPNIGPVESGADVEHLCRRVESARKWPVDTVTVVSFQRLESPAPVGGSGT